MPLSGTARARLARVQRAMLGFDGELVAFRTERIDFATPVFWDATGDDTVLRTWKLRIAAEHAVLQLRALLR